MWNLRLRMPASKIEVLERDTGMWDTAKAKEKMDAWISKYDDDIEIIIAEMTQWRLAYCSLLKLRDLI